MTFLDAPRLAFTAEYAPGFSPTNLPGAMDWEPLGSVRQAAWHRGRQDETDDMQPGAATLVVDDPDATIFVDAVGGLIPPLTPVRVKVISGHGTTTTIRFTGFMVDSPQPAGNRRGRIVTISAVDWMGWAATVPAAATKWEAYVQERSPRVWYRNDFDGGIPLVASQGDRVLNVGSLGAAGNLHSIIDPAAGFPLYLDALSPNPVPDGDGFMWVATGAASTPGPVEFSSGSTYTIVFWFLSYGNHPTLTNQFFTSRTAAGSEVFTFRVNPSGHISVTVGCTNGTTATATVAANHGDADPHLVIVRVGASLGTLVAITSDLGSDNTSLGGATPRTTGTVELISSNVSFLPAVWNEFAILPNVSFPLSGLSSWVSGAGPDTWSGDDAGERLTHIFNAARIENPPTIVDHTDASATSQPLTQFGGALADAVNGVAASRLGSAYMTPDGELRIRDFDGLTDPSNAAFYDTVDSNLTDWDDELAPQPIAGVAVAGDVVAGGPDLPVVRRGVSGTTAGRLTRIINEVRITNPLGYVTAHLDEPSRQAYGRRPIEYSSDTFVSFRAAGDDIVDRRARPSVEIGEVTVEPWTSAAAEEFVVGADIDQVVHYLESRPAPSNPGSHPEPIVSGVCRIQHEAWSWTGTDVSVTYRLALIESDYA